jgi:ubiquinone/menaquinone biosynthesis C-methylase UbiE
MNEYERAVGLHYDNNAFAFELERLEKHHSIEFFITLRALARWLPASGGVCVEVGVGSGAYSLWLAARGHKLHLVDVSTKLLEATIERLRVA